MAPDRAPLVIVTEQGKHDEAARRIVRAQAARASAQQSRLTRARNRDEKQAKQTTAVSTQETPDAAPPLMHEVSASSASSALTLTSSNSSIPPWSDSEIDRRLPLALPRGFVEVSRHVKFEPTLLALISQTACFDLASPGVEDRLRQLLDRFDTVQSAQLDDVQGLIWCACVSLLLQYSLLMAVPDLKGGFSTVWQSAVLLGARVAPEIATARVICWATIVVSATSGIACQVADDSLSGLARSALGSMEISSWEGVRVLLLEFIYPSSVVGEACALYVRQSCLL